MIRDAKEHFARGRLSTVDHLIKVARIVKKINDTFKLRRSSHKLVSTRRSTVLSLPLRLGFPGQAIYKEFLMGFVWVGGTHR